MNSTYKPHFFFLALLSFGTTSVYAQLPFSPIDTNFHATTVILPPSPLKYDTLFIAGHHQVYNPANGQTALAKDALDYIGLSQVNANRSWVIVNHESSSANAALGDGGGQTVFRMDRTNGRWKVVNSLNGKPFTNVDFTKLGGTLKDCGGGATMNKTVLAGEENPPSDNATLYNNGFGFTDTSDYVIPAGNGSFTGKTLKRWQNMGWMVETKPSNAKAIRKCYAMGRYSHEGAACMKDSMTVYLTDDALPAVLFKFVADVKNNFTEGQLYAYKQNANGIGGSWLPLSRSLDSLLDARTHAFHMGATAFTRLEWVVTNNANNKLYISETGSDNAALGGAYWKGGTFPLHFRQRDTLGGAPADYTANDYYGRVLELNLNTNTLRVLVEGGNGSNPKTNFAQPDAMTYGVIKGKQYLIISEDLNATSQNRNPANAGGLINEIYFLDLSIENPKVDDLKRFMVGPMGCETTGGALTKNGDTYLVNIMHPSGGNPFPFNRSVTIAVTGFTNVIASAFDQDETNEIAIDGHNSAYPNEKAAPFAIFPNPTSREIRFNKTVNVVLYNAEGQALITANKVSKLDISDLTAGEYFIHTDGGETQKLIVE